MGLGINRSEMDLTGLETSLGQHLHCLICADLILKREILEENFDEVQNNGEIFKALFKLFKIKLSNKISQSVLWIDQETERPPFCSICQNQVVQLIQLWKQLEEMKQVLDKGKMVLKDKLESSEGTFKSSGIYKKDGRYLRARNLILKRHDVEEHQNLKIVTQPSKSPSRVSARNLKKGKINYAEIADINPHVLLSVIDKKTAEEYHSIVKTELNIPLENPNTEETFSPPPPMINEDTTAYSNSKDELSPENLPINKPKQFKKGATKARQTKRKKGSDSNSDEDWDPSKEKVERRGRSSSKMTSSGASPSSANVQNETEASDEESADSEDDIDEDSGSRTTKLKFNKITGACSYLHVTLEKVDDDEYKCCNCEQLVSKKHLRHHIIREHTNRTTCKQCGKKFNVVSKLNLHIKQIHEKDLNSNPKPRGDALFNCPNCDKPFWLRTKLKIHQWSHYNAQERLDAVARGEKDPTRKAIQCDTCGRQFKTPSDLRKHKIVRHPTPSDTREMQICTQCGKEVYDIQKHMKIHENEDAPLWFVCSVCSKGFPNRRRLSLHKKFHELPHKCTICGKGYPKKDGLQQHINLHLGYRPYQCPQCEASFASGSHLKKHVKNYHGEGAQPKRKSYVRGLTKKGMERKITEAGMEEEQS